MVSLIKLSDHLKTGQKKCLTSQIFRFQVFGIQMVTVKSFDERVSAEVRALSYKDALDMLPPARCSGVPITGHYNYGTIQIVDNAKSGYQMFAI